MSLVFPEDVEAWLAWQRRRHRVRRVKQRLRPTSPAPARVTAGGPRPRVLVVMEGGSPSNRAAFLGPVAHMPPEEVAVLSTTDLTGWLPRHTWTACGIDDVADGLAVVLAAGHYGLGRAAWGLARSRDLPFLVAQHGLLTPHAPPLPADTHLLAWSDPDATFWWSGRTAATTVVGSQLLWDAGSTPIAAVEQSDPLTYLGQLHGAELPRRRLARAAGAFCVRHGATYRPHPSETDRLSRWQHRRWERRGVVIDRAGVPLRDSATPVVSVFSTGVLEAAARGLPAWVDFPHPPPWLREFWDRYDMRPYGADPTPAPPRPDVEPAAAVAEILRSHL